MTHIINNLHDASYYIAELFNDPIEITPEEKIRIDKIRRKVAFTYGLGLGGVFSFGIGILLYILDLNNKKPLSHFLILGSIITAILAFFTGFAYKNPIEFYPRSTKELLSTPNNENEIELRSALPWGTSEATAEYDFFLLAKYTFLKTARTQEEIKHFVKFMQKMPTRQQVEDYFNPPTTHTKKKSALFQQKYGTAEETLVIQVRPE